MQILFKRTILFTKNFRLFSLGLNTYFSNLIKRHTADYKLYKLTIAICFKTEIIFKSIQCSDFQSYFSGLRPQKVS